MHKKKITKEKGHKLEVHMALREWPISLSTLKIFDIFLSFLREPEKTQGQIFMDVTSTMYAVYP